MTSTMTSRPVRTKRMDRPVRREIPVMRPSRGPGPYWLPMYRAPARPLRMIPPSRRAVRAGRPEGASRTARVASVASPMMMTFATVPSPGHCRSGIHSSSTPSPDRMTTVPKDIPVC